jgi:hypothetical protein
MNEEYAEKHRMLSMEGRFKFSCHNGLSCFKTCCADINIFLTPYDLLRMRWATGLSSEEFLKYPIFPSSSREEEFFIKEDSSCLGLKEEKWWTIHEWKKDQGIDIYDKMNESYKEITLHDYFQKGNKLDPGRSKMLYTACYNLDEFKRFLFETRFFDIYDVEKGIIERIKEDRE